MRRPLLHIGYHKTGSTFLQRGLFSEKAAGFSLVAGPPSLVPAFASVNGFAFDASETASFFMPQISRAFEEGLVPTLSAERMSGSPYRGGYDSRIVADRLAETFPNARVLIVIREQADMVLSLYKTYVRMGGPASLTQYALSSYETWERAALFRFDYLEYHRLIGHYQTLFDPENVLVLPYELLRARPRRFILRVARFAGSRAVPEELSRLRASAVNVSPSALSLGVKRRMNKWVVRGVHNPSPVLPVSVSAEAAMPWVFRRIDRAIPKTLHKVGEDRWHRLIAGWTKGRYEESNVATENLTGLDLRRFGYRL